MPPVVLCILDGWGLSKNKVSNAPLLAKTPNYDRLWQTCPKTKLLTHGLDVGLPKGQMGNSEVGHMNIGAGRIISMDLGQIDLEIKNENFFENKILLKHIQDIKKNNGRAHLMSLFSDGACTDTLIIWLHQFDYFSLMAFPSFYISLLMDEMWRRSLQ